MIPVCRPSLSKEEVDAVAGVFESGWLGRVNEAVWIALTGAGSTR